MSKCDFNKVAKQLQICCIFSEHLFLRTLLLKMIYYGLSFKIQRIFKIILMSKIIHMLLLKSEIFYVNN